MKYVAWTKDKKDLKEASSGGVFYELAKNFIANGGLVCGVVMKGWTPRFRITDTLKGVKKMRGSKYLWAADIKTIYDILEYDIVKEMYHDILFVGLPCQVTGLKRHFKLRNLNDDHITYVSLRCHGVIRTKVFQDYIKYIKNTTRKPIRNIKFREKNPEWKGAGFGFNGLFFRPKIIKDYIKKKNVYPMCKTCDKDRNDSDITLGDAWGVHPALINRYGTSIVETNTPKGQQLFSYISNSLQWKPLTKKIRENSNKIGLLKVADYQNFGNQMLSSNFITYMKAINKRARFVFIENDSAQDIIEKSTGVKDIEYRHIETLSRHNFKKVLLDTFIGLVNPQEMEQVKVFADCKHVAVLGGDHFSGGIHYATWIINLIRLNALAKCGKQIHIVSNTLGAFPWFLRPLVRYVLRNMKTIWCRDTDSIKRLNNINVYKNVCYAPDLAFLPLHNELRNNVEATKDMYCTLVVSTLWKQYANTYNKYIEGVKTIANSLYQQTKRNVIILPHSTYESDLQIARDIADNKHIFAAIGKKPMTPSKARAILANSYMNISFRMHGAISSLMSGVPVIAIAYSPKYEGVISNGYDLPELVVRKYSRRKWDACISDTLGTLWFVLKQRDRIIWDISSVNFKKATDAIKPLLKIGGL